MRKNFVLIMALICLHAFGQINERATAFEFPFQPGDAQWKSFSSPQERIAALQIPEDELKTISTNDLLNACLDFPYSMDILAFDSPEIGFKTICKEFNGYRELLTRQDLVDALLAKCEDVPNEVDSILNKDELTQGNYSFKCYILFYMMGIDEVTSSLNSENMGLITSSIRTATEKMKDYPEIFGISYQLGYQMSSTIQKSFNPNYKDARRIIFSGDYVNVKELISNELSSSEKIEIKNIMLSSYPELVVVSDPTSTYNCHAYAWYMKSFPHNDPVWIDDPSIYWESGCYYEVPESDADVVLYYDTLNPYYGNWHSAIRINSNEYISKWGRNGLFKHSPSYVHHEYGGSRKYYKQYLPTLTGKDLITTNETYSIGLLPNDYSVTWTLSDNYYAQNCMVIDSNGNCTITRDATRDMYYATLTARIWFKGNLFKAFTKTVHAFTGFKIFYDWSTPNNKQPLASPYIIYRNKTNEGIGLNINSPNLIGATVTYEGDMTPSRWVFDEFNGHVNILFPSSTSAQTLVINIKCNVGNYRLIVLNQARSYSLSTQIEGDNLNILIANENSDDSVLKSTTIGVREVADEELEWTLEVYDTGNNRIIYSNKVTRTEASVNTSGWTPGIYVVRATIGDQTFSKKILIK